MEGKKTSSTLVTQSASFMAQSGVPLNKFRNLRSNGFLTSQKQMGDKIKHQTVRFLIKQSNIYFTGVL
jgi:hypothetical protein